MSERQYIYGDREILIPKTAPGDNWLEISVNGTRARLPKGVPLYLSDAAYEVVTQALADWHPPSDPAERDKLPATIGDVKRIAGEGGGGTTVTLTETETENVYTADMTVAEVIAAFRRGPVYVRLHTDQGTEVMLHVCMIDEDEDEESGWIYAAVSLPQLSSLYCIRVQGGRDKGAESWTVRSYNMGVLPETSSADDGKVLGVRHGDWTTEDASSMTDHVINFAVGAGEGGGYTATTEDSCAAAIAADAAGKTIRARFHLPGGDGYTYGIVDTVGTDYIIIYLIIRMGHGTNPLYIRVEWDAATNTAGVESVPLATT